SATLCKPHHWAEEGSATLCEPHRWRRAKVGTLRVHRWAEDRSPALDPAIRHAHPLHPHPPMTRTILPSPFDHGPLAARRSPSATPCHSPSIVPPTSPPPASASPPAPRSWVS